MPTNVLHEAARSRLEAALKPDEFEVIEQHMQEGKIVVVTRVRSRVTRRFWAHPADVMWDYAGGYSQSGADDDIDGRCVGSLEQIIRTMELWIVAWVPWRELPTKPSDY